MSDDMDALLELQLSTIDENNEQQEIEEVFENLTEIDFDDELECTGIVNDLNSLTSVDNIEPSSQNQNVTGEDNFINEITSRLCSHNECNSIDLLSIATEFYKFNMVEKLSYLRPILFSLSSPAGTQNNLLKTETTPTRRKRKVGELNTSRSNTTTCFAFLGKRICLQSFATVFGLSQITIQRYARDVTKDSIPKLYANDLNLSRKGKWGIQRIVVKAFLNSIARDHGLECPRGRGSTDESPIRIIPSYYSKRQIYKEYEKTWALFCEGALDVLQNFEMPDEKISYNLFVRYWNADMPLLRIATSASDFCDTCTKLKNTMSALSKEDPVSIASRNEILKHLREAKMEFQLYKLLQESTRKRDDKLIKHFVFDFAEKVLLPRLLKQPGQLHFITGLKFDIFGIACSNDGLTDIYGLVEGHWPQEKTANVVLSMLHCSIMKKFPLVRNLTGTKLLLHADNCAGQNKNRFVLSYVVWRVLMGFDEEVVLYFLISGHTKNVCDECFGHIKRHLRNNDAVTPFDMMRIIDDSSTSNTTVAGSSVWWFNWKDMLDQYFKIPKTLKISKYHVFSARQSHPGTLFVKALSNGEEHQFLLLKDENCRPQSTDLTKPDLELKATPLVNVRSQNHGDRYSYLKKEIMDRYYGHDSALSERFFMNGT